MSYRFSCETAQICLSTKRHKSIGQRAVGWISITANFLPGQSQRLFDDYKSGNTKRARLPLTAEEAKVKSGIAHVVLASSFQIAFHKYMRQEKNVQLLLNLDRFAPGQQQDEAAWLYGEYFRHQILQWPLFWL